MTLVVCFKCHFNGVTDRHHVLYNKIFVVNLCRSCHEFITALNYQRAVELGKKLDAKERLLLWDWFIVSTFADVRKKLNGLDPHQVFTRRIAQVPPLETRYSMHRLALLLALALGLASTSFAKPQLRVPLRAQVGPNHTVALSWVLSTDDTTSGCTAPNTCAQTIYRALGACSTSNTFTSLASPSASSAAFTDTTVVPGTYCYAVTFTQNGLESVKDTATVILPPFAPSSLAGLSH